MPTELDFCQKNIIIQKYMLFHPTFVKTGIQYVSGSHILFRKQPFSPGTINGNK